MSKDARTLLLGYEVGASGASVEIPLKHMAITGQTQEAGKTTALEGLIARSGLKAVTFITKRGEASFTGARRIEPYFREQADWQFVASILEASRGEKLKFERAWIIRASRGAKTLADVQRNVRKAMETAKGMSADVYLTLDAYLEVVVPEIETIEWAHGVDLRDGVNAVDLTDLSLEMQHLVIRSTISWVLNREKNTVVVIPEAWKFIPRDVALRSSSRPSRSSAKPRRWGITFGSTVRTWAASKRPSSEVCRSGFSAFSAKRTR
jgi:hypothetical protein